MASPSGEEESVPDQPLFEEFEAATFEDWQREALRSLKGAPLSRLARRTPEGFAFDPIYGPWQSVDHSGAAAPDRDRPWVVCQEVRAADARTWNELAQQEVRGGADGLVLCPSADDGFSRAGQLQQALAGLDLSSLTLVIEAGAQTPALARILPGSRDMTGALAFDPLASLVTTGTGGLAAEEMAELVRWCEAEAPGLTALTCHGEPYHEGGASAVQELAFTLATAAQYLRTLVELGLEPEVAARHVELSFAVGSRLLTEVAKLRAARLLWHTITSAFGCSSAQRVHGAPRALIRACTSAWSQSVYDPWVNLLRSTVQAFAAIVGGADRVTLAPFDAVTGQPDAFSRRLARNTQLILRDEAFLHRVVDPAAGSWAVEALTDRLGREAWALLQEVERRGGMLAAAQEGFPQGEVRHTADERRQAVSQRREPIVGVSVYPDPDENPRPGPPSRGMNGLPRWRAAEAFEMLRGAADDLRQRTGRGPLAHLACWGEAARLRARIDWVAGAMRAGGFGVEGEIHESVDAAARAAARAVEAPHVVVVACAADEAYADDVPRLRQAVAKAPLVVAGTEPEDSPAWAEGVLFLHRKTDLAAALDGLQRTLGVRS